MSDDKIVAIGFNKGICSNELYIHMYMYIGTKISYCIYVKHQHLCHVHDLQLPIYLGDQLLTLEFLL